MKHQNLLEEHLKLVLEANKITNITAIRDYDEGWRLHVLDSFDGLPELEAAPAGPFADMGSGAGYPGIPLAIETGREALLIDSVQKKAKILESFIETLGLSNVSVSGERIETVSLEYPAYFSAVTARALSKISILMELASPLLQMHGHLICYKAQVEDEELQHALSLQKKLGYRLYSDRLIERDGLVRRIVVFEKVSKPSIKLPRHIGFAQKKPL